MTELALMKEGERGWKRVEECGHYSSGSGQEPVMGSCEYGDEYSSSVKCWNFFQ
jgi:hypothetical protein